MSIRDQLATIWDDPMAIITEGERVALFLSACEEAPRASAGTKRKWRRTLRLD